MKVFFVASVPLILLHYSAAVPTVSVDVRGENSRVVEQGQAAYIDINSDSQSFEITILCKWSAIDSVTTFEIVWWENQLETSGIVVHRSTTRHLLGNSGSYAMNSTTFRSGRYGCAIWNGDEVTNSTGVVFLSKPPTVTIEQQEGVHLGGTAVFSCKVEDGFDAFPVVVTRQVAFRHQVGNDPTPRDLSSVLGGKWRKDGTTLRIMDVQKWAVDVRVACLVTGPTSAVKPQGDYYWSQYVPITVFDPPPPLAPAYIAIIAIGGTFLLVLLLILPIALIVIVFRKKRQVDPGSTATSTAVVVEQELAHCCIDGYPCLGQDMQALWMDDMERIPGMGAGYTPLCTTCYDQGTFEEFPLPGACVSEPRAPTVGKFQ